MANLASGTMLGDRFRVDAAVTQTASATIYAATSVANGGKVFLKMLLPMLARDREDRGRFEREFEMMARLRHNAVAAVSEMGQGPDGVPFQVMEFLDGETLAKRLERGPMTTKHALAVVMQLLDAMRLAHGQQVVHRDLQPGNLFVVNRPDGLPQLKIISFGVARATGASAPGAGQALTAYGTTLGSPEYMAPEQARGTAVDGRADIYSIGCITYAMLSGAPPFPGKQTAQVIMRHMKEDPRSLVTLRPEVPPWFDMWVLRCLRKKPEERFATAGEAREVLESAMETGFVPPPSMGAPSEAPTAPMPAPAAPAPAAPAPRAASATPVAGVPAAPAAAAAAGRPSATAARASTSDARATGPTSRSARAPAAEDVVGEGGPPRWLLVAIVAAVGAVGVAVALKLAS